MKMERCIGYLRRGTVKDTAVNPTGKDSKIMFGGSCLLEAFALVRVKSCPRRYSTRCWEVISPYLHPYLVKFAATVESVPGVEQTVISLIYRSWPTAEQRHYCRFSKQLAKSV